MAESNFGTPLHNPFSMPIPAGPHAQSPPTSPPPDFQPSFADYANATWNGDYHHFPSSQFDTQIPVSSQGPSGRFHQLYQYHQISTPVSSRNATYHHGSGDMFSHGPVAPPAQGPQPGQFHSAYMSGMSSSPHPDFGELRNNTDQLPMIEPTTPGNHAYNLPSYSQLTQPHMLGFQPFHGRRPISAMPIPLTPPSGRFASDTLQPIHQGRGSLRGMHHGASTSPRVVPLPSRRTSYDRQHQSIPQATGGPDRRPQSVLSTHSRRSDRSVSPRTSHRRSFDRYATDLPPSSSSSDAEEVALRQRAHRVRQQRNRAMLGGPEFRRVYAPIDSNTPSHAQIQALKDKLRHFLPSELPEGSSTACDICQKDFSTKHVLPTEEDEVAIQLPCKHVFGEFCFEKWVDTCKEHKNKITCPMCRELLVKPVERLSGMPHMMALFSRNLEQGSLRQLSQLSQQDREILERVMGPLGSFGVPESDVAHI
jgi:hypothetical protein